MCPSRLLEQTRPWTMKNVVKYCVPGKKQCFKQNMQRFAYWLTTNCKFPEISFDWIHFKHHKKQVKTYEVFRHENYYKTTRWWWGTWILQQDRNDAIIDTFFHFWRCWFCTQWSPERWGETDTYLLNDEWCHPHWALPSNTIIEDSRL
jgi:hypothetical protein